MAQATVTYYCLVDAKIKEDFAALLFYAIGKALYGKVMADMIPADVTVRTLQLDHRASLSSAGIELHIEVASGEWPKDLRGSDLNRIDAETKMKKLSQEVFNLIAEHEPTGKGLNIWSTQYPATGWAASVI